jgi:hypothetical protein
MEGTKERENSYNYLIIQKSKKSEVEFIYLPSINDSLEEKQDTLKIQESESEENYFREDESNKEGINQEYEKEISTKELNYSHKTVTISEIE